MFNFTRYTYCLILFLFISLATRAQLVINEVSQGPAGSQEYVELLVVGTPACNSIPCMDLRGYIIDDNNGTYAPGAGTGIAQGCVRFTTNSLWQCVPVGTLIVIYNDADLNPGIPAQDLSLTDGNCVLVIPVSNCTLLEKNTSTPSTAVATYPTTGYTSCGSWTPVSMANGGDSFQTVDPSGNPIFAVSWGNNNLSTMIYFAAGQGGMVCSMTNSTNNNPATQANWVSQSVTGNQTPGAPNNAANAAWINSMNNSCTALTPLATVANVTNAGCSCTGSATVTASGAIAPYTYAWAPSGGTASVASGLCTGIYTVTVTSSNGCTQTTTVSVGSTSPITTSVSTSSVSCNGGSNGTATVTTSGATGTVTYTWMPGGGNASSASGLSAGNYTVNVSDGIGCSATQTVNIAQPLALSITPAQTNVLCNGGASGTASVSVSGGTGAYTYTWAPGGGNSASATGLSAGNYTCTVADINNCTQTQAFNITEPSPLSIIATQTNVTCNGGSNGQASVSVSGGTGVYTYTWSPGGGNASSATGLSAGNYTVVVNDANNCSASQTFSITTPSAITHTPSQTDVTCNGGTNGSATVAASGGNGAYTYTWSPTGGNGSSASGLSAGNYTVVVNDVNNCSASQTYVIGEPAAFTVTPNQTNVSCNGGADGQASVSVSGGTSPYTYAWSPGGGNASSASGLSAGNYTVAISDLNNCGTTQIFTVSQPSALSAVPTQTNVSCNGGADGIALVAVSGGTGAYTYTWNPSGGNAAGASGLSAGNYTVSIADANNCLVSQSFSITDPPALTVTVSATAATCGNNNGSATVSATGGTGAYTYSWSPAGGTATSASALTAGNYTVDVSDANGCITTGTTSIINTGGATVTVSNTSVTCNNGADGTAQANANGGVTPYTYSWSPTGGTGSSANGLSAGNYTVTVTDNVGCISTATTAISQPTALSAVLTAINVLCFGGSNGTASVNASGGIGAYTYTWSPAGGNNATASGLAAGNYSVQVADANGCSATFTTSITQPTQLSLSGTTTAVACNGGSNGSASVSASGGAGSYSYNWQPSGGNSALASNLSAGIYTATVTDLNGCNQTYTATITQPTALSISISNTPVTCGANNATANATVNGGTGPYAYLWQPTGGSTANASGLSAGAYTLVVADSHSCIATGTTTIANASTMTVSAAGTAVTCNGAADGTATCTVNGGATPYTYSWSGGGGSAATANNLAAGNYTVTVTDGGGCAQSATVAIAQPQVLTVAVSGTTVCNGQSATLGANANGGTSPYQYGLNGGALQLQNTFNVTPASTTSYTVVVTDAAGCTSSATAQVTVLPALQVTVGDANICQGGQATLNANASGGNGTYSYSWLPGNLSGSSVSVSPSNTTIYTVTVSDGCTGANASDTGIVTVVSVPTPTLLPAISGCAPLCVNFTVTPVTGITGFHWNFGDNSSGNGANPTHCYTNSGNFNVALTYSTTLGCTNTITSNGMVNVFPQPHAAFAASTYETTTFASQISFFDQSTGNVNNWQWNFGDLSSACTIQNPTHNYTAAGDYLVYLSVQNQYGCKDSTSAIIKIKEDFTFYAPNAFTPDGDDYNEQFLPTGIGWDNTTFNLWIYDRWGNQVFYSADPGNGWDGTKKGNQVQQDVYVWEVHLKDLYGVTHKYQGTVSLAR